MSKRHTRQLISYSASTPIALGVDYGGVRRAEIGQKECDDNAFGSSKSSRPDLYRDRRSIASYLCMRLFQFEPWSTNATGSPTESRPKQAPADCNIVSQGCDMRATQQHPDQRRQAA